jgi:hypothetical protein
LQVRPPLQLHLVDFAIDADGGLKLASGDPNKEDGEKILKKLVWL